MHAARMHSAAIRRIPSVQYGVYNISQYSYRFAAIISFRKYYVPGHTANRLFSPGHAIHVRSIQPPSFPLLAHRGLDETHLRRRLQWQLSQCHSYMPCDNVTSASLSLLVRGNPGKPML